MFSCGQSAGRSWPLLLAVALAALWAAPAQAEDYGLYVCGVQVTDANKDNLSAIPDVKEGTVTYDPATKTLRLKDARLKSYDHCIWNESVAGLTIEVEGTCGMESRVSCISMHASTTMTGKSGNGAPSLAVSSSACAVYAGSGVTCTISGLDLTATGQWGIAGDDGTSEALTIENATVRATGTEGSICDFASVTLKDCQVATPAGAAFDGGTLKKDGEVVTGEALILPDAAMGIGTTAGDAPRREGVYTLSGVRLATPLDQLPRGIYVVDGRKVVKK